MSLVFLLIIDREAGEIIRLVASTGCATAVDHAFNNAIAFC